jgi:hypothetical protein
MAIAEMGEVRYHQQRWSEAAEQLAKSKTATPQLLYMLSDSDFHLGKVDDADLTAETAAAYGRNNPELMKQLNELPIRQRASRAAAALVRREATIIYEAKDVSVYCTIRVALKLWVKPPELAEIVTV